MEKCDFYIYKYVEKKTGKPFYIGKGKSDRNRSHIRASKKGLRSPVYDRIRKLGYEKGVSIIIVKDNLTEWEAFQMESKFIESIGRIDLKTGTLLNRTFGGEGISGGIDTYGYRKQGIARKITDMVHNGMLIQDMPEEIRKFVHENKMKVKWVESRIIPHIQEMGNVGCHYKGPKITLRGWQFSLDRKMVDVNSLTLNAKGFLKVHGDLPLNKGFVAPVPKGFDFGY
jgi:hypothetical protein